MTKSSAVWLVARREVAARLASRAFRILTLIMMIAVVATIVLVKLTASHGSTTSSVAFTQPVAALEQPFVSVAGAVGQTVAVSTVDETAGQQQVRDGKLDALVTGTPGALRVVVKQDLSPALRNAFTVLVRQVALDQQLVQAGADPAAVTRAVNAASFDLTALQPPKPVDVSRLVFGILVGVLVYAGLMIYGQFVAQGVVEEKSSRVVELLLTAIRPWQLMFGKVLGIGIVGLGQLVLVFGAGAVTAAATHTISFPPGLAAGIVGWAVVWFLLGYLAYGLTFAALGALVSRQEDVSGVVAPALMLLIIPYFLGISILPANPDSPLIAGLSIVPLFAPTLMPMRLGIGVAPMWQVMVALGLTVGMIVLLIWLAGRIYGNAILRTGSRVRLRDAFRTS
jgi:ABC-2 type transport system permease protein